MTRQPEPAEPATDDDGQDDGQDDVAVIVITATIGKAGK